MTFSEKKNAINDLQRLTHHECRQKFLGQDIAFTYIHVLHYPALILPLLDQPTTIEQLVEKIKKYENCLCLLFYLQGILITKLALVEHVLKIWTLQEFEQNIVFLQRLAEMSLVCVRSNKGQKLKDFLTLSDPEFKNFFQETLCSDTQPNLLSLFMSGDIVDLGYKPAQQLTQLIRESTLRTEKFSNIASQVKSPMLIAAIQTCCQTVETIDPSKLDQLLTVSPLTLLCDAIKIVQANRTGLLLNTLLDKLSYAELRILCDTVKTTANLALSLEYLDCLGVVEESLLPLIQKKDFFQTVQAWKESEESDKKSLKRLSLFTEGPNKQPKMGINHPSPHSEDTDDQEQPGLH